MKTGTFRFTSIAAAVMVAAMVLVGCASPDEVPRKAVKTLEVPEYSVPEGGDPDPAFDPVTEPVEDVFTAKAGHFIATNPNVGGAPRLSGVIPVGWSTVSAVRPPSGTVGAFGYTSGISDHEYVPSALVGMWTTKELPEEVHAKTMSAYGPPGAQWHLAEEGRDSRGVQTDLYRGEWTSRNQPIRGFGYLAAVPYNGYTYVFTVIISQSMMVNTDARRWDTQSNILLNSIDITGGDV